MATRAGHHRADHRADMDEGAAPGEDEGEPVSQGHQEDEDRDRERSLVARERRAAKPVIDDPSDDQNAKPDRDRSPARQIEHVAVDEVELRVGVIEHAQEREARDPGPIGFPFEPMQLFGHCGRGDIVFLQMVEAPAMHLPSLAAHALRQARRPAQAEIERDEVEGFPDPGDRRDHMQPADGKIRPIPGDGGHALLLIGRFGPVASSVGKSIRNASAFRSGPLR